MWKEVTRGTGAEIQKLRNYEGQLAEGQRGRLDLYMRIPMSSGVRSVLQSRLEAAGVEDVKVTGDKVVHIEARKSFPFLAIIVVAILALAILIVSWRFFKEVAEVLPSPVIAGVVIVGILGVLLVIFIVGRGQVASMGIGGT